MNTKKEYVSPKLMTVDCMADTGIAASGGFTKCYDGEYWRGVVNAIGGLCDEQEKDNLGPGTCADYEPQ